MSRYMAGKYWIFSLDLKSITYGINHFILATGQILLVLILDTFFTANINGEAKGYIWNVINACKCTLSLSNQCFFYKSPYGPMTLQR